MSTIKIKAEKRVCYRRSRTKLFQIVAILEAVTPLPLFDDGCDTHNTSVTDMMASHRTEALSRWPGQSRHDINNNISPAIIAAMMFRRTLQRNEGGFARQNLGTCTHCLYTY